MQTPQRTSRSLLPVACTLALLAAVAGLAAQARARPPAQQQLEASVVDFDFRPPTISVEVGTEVVWTNEGETPHTITADDGSFDSGTLDPGETFALTFIVPGRYTYFCIPHPFMRGTVEVRAAGVAAAQPAALPSALAAPTAAPTPEAEARPTAAPSPTSAARVEVPPTAGTWGPVPTPTRGPLATPRPVVQPGPRRTPSDRPTEGGTAKEWPTYGGDYSNQRYSKLDQINTSNVASLVPRWTFQTGVTAENLSFQSTPIVVDGVMYLTSGLNDVYALDARTGDLIWAYHPNIDLRRRSNANPPQPGTQLCCGRNNRGVAVGHGKVYIATLDARLVALDQRTGHEVWQVRIGDTALGYSETMAPLLVEEKVIVGISGAEYANRGFVTAWNAHTGEMIWKWWTIPGPGEFGSETWPETDARDRGGGSMWMTPAYDPELRLLYMGIGNAGPNLDGTDRPGDNLFTDCIVALDVDTAGLNWYFQQVRHDLWDYDPASPPLLFDVVRDGRRIKAVGQAGKTGWFYVLNRATGESLLPIEERPVPQNPTHHTSPTQPFPAYDPFVPICAHPELPFQPQGCVFTPPTNQGVVIEPGGNGGAEWSPVAYSPRTGWVYIAGVVQPMVYTNNEIPPTTGDLSLGGTFDPLPGFLSTGTFTAFDPATGRIVWQVQTERPLIGGALATAGDLVFTGEHDAFNAYNAWTGELLWQFKTGAGANAAPIAFEIDGEQFIAVAAGGNVLQNFPRGDTLFVFGLPKRWEPK